MEDNMSNIKVTPAQWFAITEMFRKAEQKREEIHINQLFNETVKRYEKYGKLNPNELGMYRFFFFMGYNEN